LSWIPKAGVLLFTKQIKKSISTWNSDQMVSPAFGIQVLNDQVSKPAFGPGLEFNVQLK
jgi:hypothetical protein